MKRILCYGDSNTWGYIPGNGARFPDEVRWTGVLARELGPDYKVLEDGLNGRTTVFDDWYLDFRNGKKGLGYSLCVNAPIDLVILSLGTNDLISTDAIGASKGVDELLHMMAGAEYLCNRPGAGGKIFPNGLKVLILSPIHLHPQAEALRTESLLRYGYQESLRFSRFYQAVANSRNAWFLDAADYAEASIKDCVHMDADSHQRLGRGIADKAKEIFG